MFLKAISLYENMFIEFNRLFYYQSIRYNLACMLIKNSDQPAHLHNMISVLNELYGYPRAKVSSGGKLRL